MSLLLFARRQLWFPLVLASLILAYLPYTHGSHHDLSGLHARVHKHGRLRRQEAGPAPETTNLFDVDDFAESTTLSGQCASALAAPLNCSSMILYEPYDYFGLSMDNITALCTGACSESISQYRKAVLQQCANDVYTDPVINETSTIYGTPQTDDIYNIQDMSVKPIVLADYYFLNYNLTCMQDDSDPPAYCYFKHRPADGSSPGVNIPACDVCSLKALREEILDPRTYEEDLASQYSSLSSSCGLTLGPISTPTPAFLPNNATLVLNTSTTATCTGSYVPVATSDDCDAIASANSISTDSLLQINGLPGGCADFPGDLTSLCIQGSCEPRVVVTNDTCVSLAAEANATVVQFLSWNPTIDPLCVNLDKQVGHVVCLSNPLGYSIPDSVSVGGAPTGAATAALVPTDAAPQSNAKCGSWYKVNPGDYCAYVCTKNSIALSDFYFLNPQINANCTNLWADTSYCVGAVGDISTYAGYGGATTTTNMPTFVATADPAWTPMESVFTPTYSINSQATNLPIANGSLTDCFAIFNNKYGEVSCQSVADIYGVDIGDFLSWNPSLGDFDHYNPKTCVLTNATQYCASFYDQSLVPSATTEDFTIPAPSSAASNSTTSCDDWWLVQDGDTCDLICRSVDIPFASLYEWNPSIGDSCQNLWLDTSYCVAGPGWQGVSYQSASPAANSQSSAVSNVAPGPTQAGIANDCDSWYVAVAGDTCQGIASGHSISLSDFQNWNPAVGTDCAGLWADEAYCVHVPGASSATTSHSSVLSTTSMIQSPGPTQAGINSDCNAYAIPVAGDGCYSFAERNSITLDQLYEWNPVLGTDCSNFWGGEAYCIGVAS